jgi:isopentenyl-diphosphate delta-isomerase type 1
MNSGLAKDKSMGRSVVLVDESDGEAGARDKLAAQVDGGLRRAVSVCVFNSKGRLLLTRRAAGKHHSGGLWTNACCAHPRPGESVQNAASPGRCSRGASRRRLRGASGNRIRTL